MFKLEFDAKTHSYLNPYTKEVYISATQLLSKFKKAFDKDSASKRVAEREKITQEEVLAKWKKLNDESKVYGQSIHKVIEDFNKEGIITKGYEELIDEYKTFLIKNSLLLDTQKNSLLVEEKLHNHNYKLAGTADIIRIEPEGGFSVFDLKTNKKFNLYSPYSEYMLKPLSHLTVSEYTTYGLQLSLYAYMYQNMTGMRVNQLGVMYYERESKKFNYYPIPYLKTDIIKVLDYYAANIMG